MDYQEYINKKESLYEVGNLRIKLNQDCNDVQNAIIKLTDQFYKEISDLEGSLYLTLNRDQIQYFINTLGKYCKLNKPVFGKQDIYLSKYQDNKNEWNQYLELNLNSGDLKIDFYYKVKCKAFFTKVIAFLRSISL